MFRNTDLHAVERALHNLFDVSERVSESVSSPSVRCGQVEVLGLYEDV